MIRVYRARKIGTGVYPDSYRSILHDFIDVSKGDSFDEIELPGKCSICILDARKAVHDAIVAYEALNPGSVNYLSSPHADMAGLRTQYAQPWADLPLAFRTKAEKLLGADGLADFSGTIKQVLKRLISIYSQAQKSASGDTKSISPTFRFGGEDF